MTAGADFNGDGRMDLASGLGVLLQTPPVQLSPTSVNFGDQTAGTTSAAQTITLTNNLPNALTISRISVTGTDSSDFSETNNCSISPSNLAAGGTCAINVLFSPAATGVKSGVVTISDDAPAGSQSVPLAGTGVNPTANLSNSSLSFSSQPVGTTSAAQSFTVANNGVGPLAISNVAVAGDFAETNNCGMSLSQGAVCTVSVTFTPTSGGTRAGGVTITDDAANSPQTVNLSGVGVPPTVTLNPVSLSFPTTNAGTTSNPQAIALTNNGPGPLTISSLAFSGTNGGDFAETDNCPVSPNTLAASAGCTINVTFKPTRDGSETATLTISDNASSSSQSASLSGTGVAPMASLSTLLHSRLSRMAVSGGHIFLPRGPNTQWDCVRSRSFLQTATAQA